MLKWGFERSKELNVSSLYAWALYSRDDELYSVARWVCVVYRWFLLVSVHEFWVHWWVSLFMLGMMMCCISWRVYFCDRPGNWVSRALLMTFLINNNFAIMTLVLIEGNLPLKYLEKISENGPRGVSRSVSAWVWSPSSRWRIVTIGARFSAKPASLLPLIVSYIVIGIRTNTWHHLRVRCRINQNEILRFLLPAAVHNGNGNGTRTAGWWKCKNNRRVSISRNPCPGV